MTGAPTDGPRRCSTCCTGSATTTPIWLRRTSIERYVAPLGLAVVMPQVHRSFYADEALRRPVLDLPRPRSCRALVGSFFRVSTDAEDTFVAGLSMGGYGALKWALRQPERFAAAASLSGALDVGRPADRAGASRGPAAVRPGLRRRDAGRRPDDLLWLLDRADRGRRCRRCYLCCGTEDLLDDDNRAFGDRLRGAPACR